MLGPTPPGPGVSQAVTLPRPAADALARGRRSRPGLGAAPGGGRAYARRVAAISLGGLVARVALLGHQPLWRDEAFTELTARHPWLSMLDVVRHDSAPPLSYLVTHLFVATSTDPVALRLPSALLGTLAVPLAAALGRRLGGDRGGTHAAGLIAVMPALLLAARDARMYALAGTLSLAVTLLLWRAVELPSRGRLAALAGVAAAALLTQYLTAFTVVAAALAAWLALRPAAATLRRVATALGLSALPLLAWLPAAAPQFSHIGAPFWVKPLGPETLLGVLTQFFAGPAVDAAIPHRALIQVLQGGAISLGGVAGLRLLLSLPRMTSGERRAHAYVAGAGLGAILILVLVSTRAPYMEARYASVMWTPLAVLVGAGIARMRPRLTASLPLGAMAAASLALVWIPTRADVGALAGQVDGRAGGHDVILADPDLYLQGLVAFDPPAAQRTHVPAMTLPWYWGVAVYPPDAYLAAIPSTAGRVWVLSHPNRDGPPLQLPAGYQRRGRSCATDACLTVYSR